MARAVKKEKAPLFSCDFMPDKVGNTLVNINYMGKQRQLRKTVTLDAFMKLLVQSHQKTPVYHKIGQLPKGFVNGAYGTDGSFKAVIHVPGKRRCLNFFNSRHFFIPFPDLYFYFEVSKEGNVIKKKCYAHDGISETLFHYPFGNVDNGGSICMGNILCKAHTMLELERIVDDFFMSVTNNDYANQHLPKQFENQLQLLEALEKRKGNTFPKAYLIDNGESVKSLVEELRFF